MSDQKNIHQSTSHAHNAATSGTGNAIINKIVTFFQIIIHPNSTSPEARNPQQPLPNIDELVRRIRVKNCDHLRTRHGKMKLWGMDRPMEVAEIYTNVNILEKITANQRLSIAEIQDLDFLRDRNVATAEVLADEVVESEPKLMILGKPGAGKTMFLKHLTLRCILGETLPNHIPLFIALKDVEREEVKLFDYINERLKEYGVEPPQVERLLDSGKLLILLDGLDEVQGDKEISRKVEQFTKKYANNRFVITCRIAAREYIFEQFTDVEIADFNKEQIELFVDNWFAAKNDLDSSDSFIDNLNRNDKFNELAKTPLLLTLLCLVFEGKGEFPPSRVQLYEEYLGIFLKEWDASREIERDQPLYAPLSYEQKEELLCEIAHSTFERNKHFFTSGEVDECIKQYFGKTFGKSTSVQLNTKKVLELIESQHGLIIELTKDIYSFSHLYPLNK